MTAFLCILAGLFLVWLADKAWKLPSRWTPADAESYHAPPDHDWH